MEAGKCGLRQKEDREGLKTNDHDVVMVHHGVATRRYSTNKLTWRIRDIHEDCNVVPFKYDVVIRF